MKKLILFLLLIGLPCQAEQFKEVNGVFLNKNLINSVKVVDGGIIILHPHNRTEIRIKDKAIRIKTYNEIKKWLMEK